MKKYLHQIKPGQRFSGKIEAIDNDTLNVLMNEGSLLRIESGEGIEIFCASGLLWMTQENDVKDYFFAAGEEFQINRSGLVILQALGGGCNIFMAANKKLLDNA